MIRIFLLIIIYMFSTYHVVGATNIDDKIENIQKENRAMIICNGSKNALWNFGKSSCECIEGYINVYDSPSMNCYPSKYVTFVDVRAIDELHGYVRFKNSTWGSYSIGLIDNHIDDETAKISLPDGTIFKFQHCEKIKTMDEGKNSFLIMDYEDNNRLILSQDGNDCWINKVINIPNNSFNKWKVKFNSEIGIKLKKIKDPIQKKKKIEEYISGNEDRKTGKGVLEQNMIDYLSSLARDYK